MINRDPHRRKAPFLKEAFNGKEIKFLDKAISLQEQKAFNAYKVAADKGDAHAQFWTARCYETGMGTSTNINKVFHYHKLAASQGFIKSLLFLGGQFDQYGQMGFGGHTADYWYKQAVFYFQKAADAKDSFALKELGKFYEAGDGVPQDFTRAYELYKQANELGSKDGLYYQAMCLLSGRGVKQNQKAAVELFLEAIEKYNHPKALYDLGVCYGLGEGVSKDSFMARLFTSLAAKQGHGDAAFNMGVNYAGRGYDGAEVRDVNLSIFWFTIAANRGILKAFNCLAQIHRGLAESCKAENKNKEAKDHERKAQEYTQKSQKPALDLRNNYVIEKGGHHAYRLINQESRLEVQNELNKVNLLQISDAMQKDKHAKRIQYLLDQIGLIQEVQDIITLWEMKKIHEDNIDELLETQILACESKYKLISMPEDKIEKLKAIKQSISFIDLAEKFLDLNQFEKFEAHIKNCTDSKVEDQARIDYIKQVFKHRQQITEDKILTDKKCDDAIIKIDNLIGKEGAPIQYAQRALLCILKKDWHGARRDLFENIKFKHQEKDPFIIAVMNVYRALQQDAVRANEKLAEGFTLFTSPDLEVACAIIQVKSGLLKEGLQRVRHFSGKNAFLYKVFIDTLEEHIHHLKQQADEQQLLTDLELISKQGLSHSEFDKLRKALLGKLKPIAITPKIEKLDQPKIKKKKKKPKPLSLDAGDAKHSASDNLVQSRLASASPQLMTNVNIIAKNNTPIKEAKLPSELLQYSLPEDIDQLVCLLQSLSGKQVKIAGSVNRDKVEVVAGKKSQSKPITDVDIVTEGVIGIDELKNACEKAHLPLPYSPSSNANLLQWRFPGIKVDMRWDPELFTQPKKAILARDFTPNSLLGVRHPDKNLYQIEDPSERGISDIVNGLVSPLLPIKEWKKSMTESGVSEYWVRLPRLVKLICAGYKFPEQEMPALLEMISHLKTVLTNKEIASHFENHFRKLFLNGYAESAFRVLLDLNMLTEVFPFLNGINLKVGSYDFNWISKNLRNVDHMVELHKTNNANPLPAIRYIYAMFIAVGVHKESSAALSAYLQKEIKDSHRLKSDLYRKVNDYFDLTANNEDSQQRKVREIISSHPIFGRIFSGQANQEEWLVRHQLYFRMKSGVEGKEVAFKFNPSFPSQVGKFKSDLAIVSGNTVGVYQNALQSPCAKGSKQITN